MNKNIVKAFLLSIMCCSWCDVTFWAILLYVKIATLYYTFRFFYLKNTITLLLLWPFLHLCYLQLKTLLSHTQHTRFPTKQKAMACWEGNLCVSSLSDWPWILESIFEKYMYFFHNVCFCTKTFYQQLNRPQTRCLNQPIFFRIIKRSLKSMYTYTLISRALSGVCKNMVESSAKSSKCTLS